MVHPHELFLQELEKSDKELFDKVKDNPKADILDLWALSADRFIEWRRIHDFPNLLTHFDKTLKLFKEWKEENKLTNEIIIRHGEIAPFLEHQKFSKITKKYLIKQQYEGKERTFVGYHKMDGTQNRFGQAFTYTTLQEFTSYLDWLKKKGQTQEILYLNSRHAPESPMERVFIHTDVNAKKQEHELLKMGGIDIPVNGSLLHRGKKMEFVNLCGLRLSGQIYFGEMGNLSCSYCACDNWVADGLDMGLLQFEHCSIDNFTLANSKIQQWRFYDCNVSGDFLFSQLSFIAIVGGNFRPVFQDCKITEVEIEKDEPIVDNNLYAYSTLKRLYADQGDDEKASQYFFKENEHKRKNAKGILWWRISLDYYYWEYGRKPYKIIGFSLAIILVFSIIYAFNGDLVALNSTKLHNFSFLDSIYFSITTFTTLGYGDMSPLSWLRIFTSIEALSGVVNMGFLIGGYANRKY